MFKILTAPVALIALVLLGGCSPTAEEAMATCKMQSTEHHVSFDAELAYLQNCMKSQGFDYRPVKAFADESCLLQPDLIGTCRDQAVNYQRPWF
jgi:hypothetical protein